MVRRNGRSLVKRFGREERKEEEWVEKRMRMVVIGRDTSHSGREEEGRNGRVCGMVVGL